ncbi:MAG: PorP/SprF family type IX secretion system membrane protein [Brumimicrobium sp.]
MKKFKCIFTFLLCIQFLNAQDIHWSQFDHNPVLQNPVNVGQFNGDYRIHANYRDQWRSVTVPFNTFSVSGEVKNVYKNLNIGAFIMTDVAGDGKYSTVEFQPSASYTLKLSSDSTHLIRPGLQFGLNFRSLNSDAFYFDNQWNGQYFDPNLATNETFDRESRANFTVGVGLGYEFQKGKRERIQLGIGLFNINQPDQGFFGQKVKRDMRLNLYARAEYKIGFDWDVLPSLQMNLQGTYREFIIGSQIRYILKDRLGEYRAVMAGIYSRTVDALFVSVGMEYQNWWAGFSYDINYSDLTPASNVRGGFEISLRYIIHHFKPKKIQHRICPDYI